MPSPITQNTSVAAAGNVQPVTQAPARVTDSTSSPAAVAQAAQKLADAVSFSGSIFKAQSSSERPVVESREKKTAPTYDSNKKSSEKPQAKGGKVRSSA